MRPPCSRPSRPSTAAAGPVFQAGDWRRLPDRENHLKTWSDELQKQGFNYDTSQLESKIGNLRTQARLLLSRIGATKRLYERTGDTTKLTDSAYKEAEVCWICWSAATLHQQGYWIQIETIWAPAIQRQHSGHCSVASSSCAERRAAVVGSGRSEWRAHEHSSTLTQVATGQSCRWWAAVPISDSYRHAIQCSHSHSTPPARRCPPAAAAARRPRGGGPRAHPSIGRHWGAPAPSLLPFWQPRAALALAAMAARKCCQAAGDGCWRGPRRGLGP